MFKLLYDAETKDADFNALILDVFSTPLLETRTVGLL
jgi:hypothetical protein